MGCLEIPANGDKLPRKGRKEVVMTDFIETMGALDRIIQRAAACGNYHQLARFAKLADSLQGAQARLEVAIEAAKAAVEEYDVLQANLAEMDAEEAAASH
jgi:hypothetical protein